MKVERFIFGPFETNTYVVSDEQQILLVDPACSNDYEQRELEKYIEKLTANSQKPIAIIATHGHLDHLWGAKWATEKWHTPVLMHEADIPMAKAMQQQYNLFGIRRQAEAFPMEPLANSQKLIANSQILSTPGHTPGSICLYFDTPYTVHHTPYTLHNTPILISGDTLFRMGYGRTDLPGGNFSQLIDSLEHLFTLPADTLVYPGHGDFTTISAERR